MKPTPEATYERSRRLANVLVWTISLQCRRIQSSEPEDKEFLFRRWADYEFLINALWRLRKVAKLASKVSKINPSISEAINDFDQMLPDLKAMRDTFEHIEEYAVDKGRNRNVSRTALEVGGFSEERFEWLGCTLRVDYALDASKMLFKAIVESIELLQNP